MSGFRKKTMSMRGKHVDMEKLRAANESTVALSGFGGDIRMNARGDVIGNGGAIMIRREQITQNYYDKNPAGVQQVSLRSISEDSFETISQVVDRFQQQNKPTGPDTATGVIGKKGARKLLDKDE